MAIETGINKRGDKRGSGDHSKVGRKKMFENGPTPFQKHAALLLALGKKPYDIARFIGVSYDALRDWGNYTIFKELVKKYEEEFLETIKQKGFDDIKFLTDTMIQSLRSPAHRSDGLRARELLAKIRGEFSPEEMNLKISKELEKLPENELKKLEKEIKLDVTNSLTANPTRTPAA